jgi:hypothetical protein
MQKIKTNLILRLAQFGEHLRCQTEQLLAAQADIAFICAQNHLLSLLLHSPALETA